jgi:hypothetical protein
MPAPRRARTRLACRLAAVVVAAALALLPVAQTGDPLRPLLAWLAGLGLLLAAGAAWHPAALLGPALTVLLAGYTVVLLGLGGRVHAWAPVVGAGLLLFGELACWAREAHPLVRDEPPATTARAAVLAASVVTALGLGALVLLAAGLPAGGALARLAVGVLAATATFALVAVAARPTITR